MKITASEKKGILANRIAKSISDAIYKTVFKKAKFAKDPDGAYQCHMSVNWIKQNLKDNWWYKEIIFIEWNELDWKKIAKKLSKAPKFKSKAIKELIVDISDFSINGHSLIKFRDYYTDPFLKSKRVSEKEIQKFGRYWEKINV